MWSSTRARLRYDTRRRRMPAPNPPNPPSTDKRLELHEPVRFDPPLSANRVLTCRRKTESPLWIHNRLCGVLPMSQQHSSFCLRRRAHWKEIGAGCLLGFAPLGRSYAHVSLESALERRLGLVADRIRHRTDRHGWPLQFIGRKSHADVGQEITGRSSKLLLEVAGQRRARHVAKSRKLRQRPCPRRLVK